MIGVPAPGIGGDWLSALPDALRECVKTHDLRAPLSAADGTYNAKNSLKSDRWKEFETGNLSEGIFDTLG